jgi:hypothetical protein
MPGWPCTSASTSVARLPLPFGRPPRRAFGRPTFLPVPAGRPTFFPDPGGRPTFLPLTFGRPGPLRSSTAGALSAVTAAAAGAATAFTAFLRVLEPRGRPGPFLRRGAAAIALGVAGVDPPSLASADAAALSRSYSSTLGFSTASRSSISLRLSSRKSVTVAVLTARVENENDAVPGRLRNPPQSTRRSVARPEGPSVWVAGPHTSVASLFATRFRVEEQHRYLRPRRQVPGPRAPRILREMSAVGTLLARCPVCPALSELEK